MKRESRPHGSKDFEYHPHHIDDPDHYRNEIDRIFKKGKYATPVPNPEYEDALTEKVLINPDTIQNP